MPCSLGQRIQEPLSQGLPFLLLWKETKGAPCAMGRHQPPRSIPTLPIPLSALVAASAELHRTKTRASSWSIACCSHRVLWSFSSVTAALPIHLLFLPLRPLSKSHLQVHPESASHLQPAAGMMFLRGDLKSKCTEYKCGCPVI